MTRAAIYCRISRDAEGSGLGVERQRADCAALIAARGWQLAGEFVDNDVSAYSGKRRPSYERLLAALEAKDVEAVVAWHPDRLHRSPVELERFIDLIETTKAKVATVQGGEYDLATASGRMTARVVGAVARHESEHKSERQRRKALELAQAGKLAGGGTRPFGFDDDRVTVVRDEAELIREAVARVVAGESMRGICADFARRGVVSPAGTEWYPSSLRRVLTSPRVAGLREHKGAVAAVAEWPAIISRADHERVRAILLDPARRKNRVARSYLLTGFVACQRCGERMVARPKDGGVRCYQCAKGPGVKGCGRMKILAEPLELLIGAAIKARIETVDMQARLRASTGVDDSALLEELAGYEARLDELARDWADGLVDRRSWLAARERVEERAEETKAKLRAVSRARSAVDLVAAGSVGGAWDELSFDRRRAVVGALVVSVTVAPAVRGRNRFDPGRVDIAWRM